MSYRLVGQRWSTASFPAYLATIPRQPWSKAVTIHHCAAPSLAQRPGGLFASHIENIEAYYRGKGWSSGPHLFTDEDDIFGMTPLTEKGVHAISFNSNSIGIEMLGNYDSEIPTDGRGLQVCLTTAATTRALLDWMGLKPSRQTVLFHRFDPRTTKTCPGTKVLHEWFLGLVVAATPGAPILPDPAEIEPEVALVTWLSRESGIAVADLAKRLRRDGALFYLGETWVEGAYYDVATQTTMAPISEAREVLALLMAKPAPTDGVVELVAAMVEALSIPYAAAAKRVSFDGINFRWDGKPVAGAYYDKARQATMAPAAEVRALVGGK